MKLKNVLLFLALFVGILITWVVTFIATFPINSFLLRSSLMFIAIQIYSCFMNFVLDKTL